jgi:hydroxymethylpyrimidine pyrophosphatase-like HAD family hydrolase
MLPRLIAIDMDGTLLGPDGQVSERNRRALRAAHTHGIEIVVATGRRHGYAMKPLREVGIHPANALISSNGTVIRSVGHELIHHDHMPVEACRWLIHLAHDFRSTMVLTFDTVQPHGEDTRGALVCEHGCDLDNDIGKWMDANRPYFHYVDRLEDALNGTPPIQMMACGTVAHMRELIDLLIASPRVESEETGPRPTAEIVLHRTEYPERDLLILDILPVGISKASALTRLAELRGCTLAEVMAIGDNFNDLPMLEQAGHPVVMANAPEKLRDLAAARGWPVTASNAEDGVAQAIEAVLKTGVLVSSNAVATA